MERIEQVHPSELHRVLAYVLAPPDQSELAGPAQVGAYTEYLAGTAVEWEALQFRRHERVTGLVLTLLLPGSAALTMLPTPGEHGIDPADQVRVQVAALERLGRRRLHYAQALSEPEATTKAAALQQAGYGHLTSLLYLERDVDQPLGPAPGPAEATWVPFSAETREAFATTLQATYVDSLDCPELAGLRPVEDVIASHKAAGPLGSALWETAWLEGQAAACTLLSAMTRGSVLEIVYMGVVPGFRRRGVGTLLLRRAVQRARELGADRMLVVVDERNEPARHLYARFGFASIAVRDAYLYCW
jgi:ribosomal protein S18 acetylase RimI-like enzyme